MEKSFLILVCIVSPSSACADDAVKFGIFLGAVSAIEEKCEKYYVRTDAVMGNHLSISDYQYATSMEEKEKSKSLKTVDKIGCDAAAKEAAKLANKSFFEVWEIR